MSPALVFRGTDLLRSEPFIEFWVQAHPGDKRYALSGIRRHDGSVQWDVYACEMGNSLTGEAPAVQPVLVMVGDLFAIPPLQAEVWAAEQADSLHEMIEVWTQACALPDSQKYAAQRMLGRAPGAIPGRPSRSVSV